jgi:hypothetical protein
MVLFRNILPSHFNMHYNSIISLSFLAISYIDCYTIEEFEGKSKTMENLKDIDRKKRLIQKSCQKYPKLNKF